VLSSWWGFRGGLRSAKPLRRRHGIHGG